MIRTNLISLAAVLATAAWAQPAGLAAEQILDRFAEVSGGRAAFDRIQSRLTKATLELPRQGIQIEVQAVARKPNQIAIEATSELTGRIVRASDSKEAWMISAAGPRVMHGAEKESFLEESRLDRPIYWRESFKGVSSGGTGAAGGQPCTKVRAALAAGRLLTLCFDDTSGFLTMMEGTAITDGGEIPYTALVGDYRKVDGVLLAHEVKTQIMGQERITRISSIVHNTIIPEETFAPPDEIRELLKKDLK